MRKFWVSFFIIRLITLFNILHFADLFEEKPQGILSLLDDEIKKRIPSNDTFFQNLRDNFSKHSAFVIPKISKTTNKFNFVIKHFAKDVCYSAVSKNT